VQWVVELAGRLNFANFGWTADSVKVGERITATGSPTDVAPSEYSFAASSGPRLRALGGEEAVEEDRRRRAQQRNQKQ